MTILSSIERFDRNFNRGIPDFGVRKTLDSRFFYPILVCPAGGVYHMGCKMRDKEGIEE
jgi:hypothetical protein